ncbi:unnamed protein product [Amoebophrya sp. A25]|nr:unnamed protein product [Amoebophrya sp. A25]|eukprot:GSA25T00020350001.1
MEGSFPAGLTLPSYRPLPRTSTAETSSSNGGASQQQSRSSQIHHQQNSGSNHSSMIQHQHVNNLQHDQQAGQGAGTSSGNAAAPSTSTDVKVVVRIRPPSLSEEDCCFFAQKDLKSLAWRIDPFGVSPLCEEAIFDHVLDQQDRNDEIFRQLKLDDAVASTIQGFQETIFAYGQTGSGKSYTILGQPTDPGILPRCGRAMFQKLAQFGKADGRRRTVQLTACEVKDGAVVDLLEPPSANGAGVGVPGNGNTANAANGAVANGAGGAVGKTPRNVLDYDRVPVKGKVCYFSKKTIWSYEEAIQHLRYAIDSREVGSSSLNSESSRSHMVIRFHVKSFLPSAEVTCGTLTLVDLAGSEKEHENPTKNGQTEANGINVSLTHLNRLLVKMQYNQLDDSDRRQSTLNMILFDSLREDCGVTMVFCIHPDRATYQASKTSLQMAQRCKKIQRRKRIRKLVNINGTMTTSSSATAPGLAGQQQMITQELLDRQVDETEHLRKKHEFLEKERSEDRLLIDSLERKNICLQGMVEEHRQIKTHLSDKCESMKTDLTSRIYRLEADLEDERKRCERWRAECDRLTRENERLAKQLSTGGNVLVGGRARQLHSSDNTKDYAHLVPEPGSSTSEGSSSKTSKTDSAGEDLVTSSSLGTTGATASGNLSSSGKMKLQNGQGSNAGHYISSGSGAAPSSYEDVLQTMQTSSGSEAVQVQGLRTLLKFVSNKHGNASSSGGGLGIKTKSEQDMASGGTGVDGATTANGGSACAELLHQHRRKSGEFFFAEYPGGRTSYETVAALNGDVKTNPNASAGGFAPSLSSSSGQQSQLQASLALAGKDQSLAQQKTMVASVVATTVRSLRCFPLVPRIQRDGALLLSEIASQFAEAGAKQLILPEVERSILPMLDRRGLFGGDGSSSTSGVAQLQNGGPGPSDQDQQGEPSLPVTQNTNYCQVCVACSRLLAVLGQRHPGHQSEIGRAGAIAKIVDAMIRPAAEDAAEVVGHHQLQQSNASSAPNVGHANDLVVHGCWALMNLCNKHGDNQALFRKSGGITLILRLITQRLPQIEPSLAPGDQSSSSSPSHAETRNAGAYLSGCVASVVETCPENQKEFFKMGGVEILVSLFERGIDYAAIVSNVCIAVAHSCHRSQKLHLPDALFSLIRQSLLIHPDHSPVVGNACRCIATVTENCRENQRKFLELAGRGIGNVRGDQQDSGIISLLFAGMRAHAADVTLNTTVCWALANLVNAEIGSGCDQSNVNVMHEQALSLEELQWIVGQLENFHTDERFAEYCCRLLGEITKGPTSDRCSAAVARTRHALKRSTELVKLLVRIREASGTTPYVLARIKEVYQNLTK